MITNFLGLLHFNPRPPRGGRLRLSTCEVQAQEISIHAPREGGDNKISTNTDNIAISIHAPREGGDFIRDCRKKYGDIISIHAPREGGDLVPFAFRKFFVISIHAPREGGDPLRGFVHVRIMHFNPRPPRGGRHHHINDSAEWKKFQSTPPARGATVWSRLLSENSL